MTSVRSGSRRVATGVLVSATGALGVVCAFDPVGIWPLIFVSFGPILYAEHAILPRAWAGSGAAVGLGTYVGYLTWGSLSPGQRWLLLALPVAIWLGARWDLVFQRATGYRHFWWSGPALWTAGLFVLGMTPVSSWIDPAYALYRQAWLIQPVSLFAISGANLLILLTNYGLTSILLADSARQRRLAAGTVVVVLAGWTVLSVALDGTGTSDQSVRVAAVQPGEVAHLDGLPVGERRAATLRVLPELESATRDAAADGAQLVVWPEKALQLFDPVTDGAARLRQLVKETGVVLVIGYTEDPEGLNRAVVLEPDGVFSDVYDKQHPVFFADDHSAGGPVPVIDSKLGKIAAIICFDTDFEDTAREAARGGARLLAVPSEDWSGIARQHYTHLVFRAVENRMAAVKADTAWDSAIIGPDGRIVAEHVTVDASSTVLVAAVHLGTGRSMFTRTGNLLGWASIGLSFLWALILVREFRAAGRATP